MSPVDIFGGSPEHTITANNPYITDITYPSDFQYLSNVDGFTTNAIKYFLVDKRIKLLYALIQFIGENAHKTKELYWTNK